MLETLNKLKKSRYAYKIQEVTVYFRFDLEALATLETLGVDIYTLKGLEDKETCTAVVRAAIRDYADEIDADVAELATKIVNASQPLALISALHLAHLASFPPPTIGAKPNSNSIKTDWGKIRCIFCDVMHKPDTLLWSSTLREIMERWEAYAEAMGYKETPQTFKTLLGPEDDDY